MSKNFRETENQIQRNLVKILWPLQDLYKFRFMHTPNEGKRSTVNGYHLKLMGMAPGFPDMAFFKDGVVYLIELKRDQKSKVADNQIEWIDWFNTNGFKAKICFGGQDVIDALVNWGIVPPNVVCYI